jgi:hypothetical protein
LVLSIEVGVVAEVIEDSAELPPPPPPQLPPQLRFTDDSYSTCSMRMRSRAVAQRGVSGC